MSEEIRRSNLRQTGGTVISFTVKNGHAEAIVSYATDAAMRRAQGMLRNRNWTVLEANGNRIKVKARI